MIIEVIVLWELRCVFSFSLRTAAVADVLHKSPATSHSVDLSSADDMQKEAGTWKIHLSGGEAAKTQQ